MTIEHVLAVVPVAEMEPAGRWYEQLFGRAPENRPMDTLVEWRVTDSGWLQVTLDADRAGSALVNFAVDDLSAHCEILRGRGLAPTPPQEANKGVQLSSLLDPDGNTITFIGNFRIEY